jgi:hypothetical protein
MINNVAARTWLDMVALAAALGGLFIGAGMVVALMEGRKKRDGRLPPLTLVAHRYSFVQGRTS